MRFHYGDDVLFICGYEAGCLGFTLYHTLQQGLKAVPVILDREDVRQDLTFRAEDEAVMFVLGYVDSDTNHDGTSREKNGDAVIHRHFAL